MCTIYWLADTCRFTLLYIGKWVSTTFVLCVFLFFFVFSFFSFFFRGTWYILWLWYRNTWWQGLFTLAVRSSSPVSFSGRPDQTLQSPLWSGGCLQTPVHWHPPLFDLILSAKTRQMVVLFSICPVDWMKTDRRSVSIWFPHRGERDCLLCTVKWTGPVICLLSGDEQSDLPSKQNLFQGGAHVKGAKHCKIVLNTLSPNQWLRACHDACDSHSTWKYEWSVTEATLHR